MEAPKCKICGNRHYGPCITTTAKVEKPKHKLIQAAEEALAIAKGEAEPARLTFVRVRKAAEEVLAMPSRAIFDRNAYQRDYMRKKRAAEKALKAKPK